MKKEKSQINNLYVCYCLFKKEMRNTRDNERLQQLSEELFKAQEYYERLGADTYHQAFVFGNGEASARTFKQYNEGFRAALDENVKNYPIRDVLLLAYACFQNYFEINGDKFTGNGKKNLYRMVLLSDYPLIMNGDAMDILVNNLSNLKQRYGLEIYYKNVNDPDGFSNLSGTRLYSIINGSEFQ